MDKKLKIYERAKLCLERYQERETKNIKRAEEAIRFRALEQWPEQIRRDRENPNQDGDSRPCPVLDKTNQHVRQIVNEERRNRAVIKIRPVDDGADKKVAEVFTGIIRNIEDQSDAIEAYTTAGEHAVDGGYGYFRILTDYTDPMSFDQEIIIKRIRNRFSVATGVHQDSVGSDMLEAVIWEDIDKESFKKKYPKAKEVSFQDGAEWSTEETIRIAEYMWIETKLIKIYLLEDGEIVDELPDGVEPVKTRTSQIKQVKWAKITAAETLEEKDMVGSFIPLIKVIGNELVMPDGKVRTSGALEAAMDPQRLHNYAHAGFIETVALAPKAPWIAEESQIEGYEDEYAAANKRGVAVLRYKSAMDDKGRQLPRPDRVPPAGIPSGWQQMLQNTEHGVEASMGSYGPTVGAQSQEKSGIALREQKEQGFVGNYHFPDNLSRSIQHCGRILLEWIPKIFDTERIARILGEEGDTNMVYLNPDQDEAMVDRMDEFGEKIGTIYNLNVGKYDVSVSTGPSYTAKRQEAVENQIQLVSARPELMPIVGDIILSNMDWPGAEKMATRLKAMLPQQLQNLEDEEDGNTVDPKNRQALEQIAQGMEIINARGQQLEQEAAQINEMAAQSDDEKKAVEAAKQQLACDRKVFMAEARTKQIELENQVMKLMEQLDDKPDKELIKLKLDADKHDREMSLKEYEAHVKRDESGGVIDKTSESIELMRDSFNDLAERMSDVSLGINAPKEIEISRDENGEIVSVNSKPVVRDERGNLTKLSS